MVGYVVDAEQTFMVSSLLHSYQFCIRHPFMEFCSCFEQMYHIGIVLGFSSRLGKELLSDADSMHIRSLDNSSFGWFIICIKSARGEGEIQEACKFFYKAWEASS